MTHSTTIVRSELDELCVSTLRFLAVDMVQKATSGHPVADSLRAVGHEVVDLGVRAGLIHDEFSAHQGVEDDDMNFICLGGKVIGSALERQTAVLLGPLNLSNKPDGIAGTALRRYIQESSVTVLTSNPTIPLTERAAWKALEAHLLTVRELHLRKLFADEPKRAESMTVEAVGIYFDYSKNRITDEMLKLLLQLAEGSGLRIRNVINVGIDPSKMLEFC